MKRAIILALCACAALAACAKENEASSQPSASEAPDRFAKAGSSSKAYGVRILEDRDTGCRYLMLYDSGLTPLLRADGTVDCDGSRTSQ